MTNARASWNVIFTQSVYLYNCPLFEATRVEYPLSDEKTRDTCPNWLDVGALILCSWSVVIYDEIPIVCLST